MSKKYASSEVKIALAAVAAITLLFFGFNFLKGINIFKTSNSYHIEFSDILGLDTSSPIYANGYAVGTVRGIRYNYRSLGHVTVDAELNKEMRVPEGTMAEIETEMLGGVKINLIFPEERTGYMSPGDTIKGRKFNGALQKAEQMIPAIERMIPKIDSILCSLNAIASDPALAATLRNTRDITASLRQSAIRLNRLLADDMPRLTGHIDRIGQNAAQMTDSLKSIDIAATVEKVNAAVESVSLMTDALNDRLNSRSNSLGLLLNDTALYSDMSKTINSANELLTDLKAHPKRYVHFSVFGKKDK